jgi:hypothetical protein
MGILCYNVCMNEMEPDASIIKDINKQDYVFIVSDAKTGMGLVNADTNALVIFENGHDLYNFWTAHNLSTDVNVHLMFFPEALQMVDDLFDGKYEIFSLDNEVGVG